MAADKLSTGTLNHKDIASYLDYHLLGSAAGVQLFDAVRQAWAGTPKKPNSGSCGRNCPQSAKS